MRTLQLTREEARQQEFERQKQFYKNKMKTAGEATVYYALRRNYTMGKIYDMSITDFVELLKKEIEEETK